MSSINDKFNEVYTEFDPLVWNILSKYSNSGVLSSEMDDLHQEVWRTIWEKAVEEGEYPTFQIAGITRNVIKDYVRKDIKRNSYSPWGKDQTRVAYYGTGEDDSEERSGVTGVYAVPYDQFKEIEQKKEFQDFINQYPEGSKERIYVDYYLDKAYGEGGKRYTDSELAQMLGWSGTSSGAWKSFKTRMQKEIADYFKYEPEEKEYAPRGRTKKD